MGQFQKIKRSQRLKHLTIFDLFLIIAKDLLFSLVVTEGATRGVLLKGILSICFNIIIIIFNMSPLQLFFSSEGCLDVVIIAIEIKKYLLF